MLTAGLLAGGALPSAAQEGETPRATPTITPTATPQGRGAGIQGQEAAGAAVDPKNCNNGDRLTGEEFNIMPHTGRIGISVTGSRV